MKLQYGILGMALLTGGAYASDHAEGIHVGGYVDADYTWTKDTANTFSVAEGAVYVGKKVGGAHVHADVAFDSNLEGVRINQAYVENASDSGLTWRAGRFDTLFGYYGNDSHTYWLTGASSLNTYSSAFIGDHGGLMLGYAFSDMMNFSLVIDADNGQGGNNMDYPQWNFHLASKMDSFNLGLGFEIEDNGAGANQWALDLVASSMFGDYDFGAWFGMQKNGDADANMGFGAHLQGMASDDMSWAARVEWGNNGAAEASEIGFTFGPQFHVEKNFVVKTDYTFSKVSEADAGHTVAVAAVYGF